MQVLTPKMEIAFYNVIDHRCDRMEEMNVPIEIICKNITNYTERFIKSHEMSQSKKNELSSFTALIVSIYNSYPLR